MQETIVADHLKLVKSWFRILTIEAVVLPDDLMLFLSSPAYQSALERSKALIFFDN
jgi:hypothetical protein